MKKIIVLLICVVFTAVLVCGCGADSNSGNSSAGGADSSSVSSAAAASEASSKADEQPASDTSEADGSDDADTNKYVKPADYIKIDMEAADPSNDKIAFAYDAEGRVTSCSYAIDNDVVFVSYSYSGNTATLYAFMGNILVADEEITLPEGNVKDSGFAEYDGYYFRAIG